MQTKDHKFCPWAETQSQTPPSSVRTLPRRSKCVCVCTIQLLLSHTRTNTQRVLSFLRRRRAGGKLPGAFLGGCEGVRAVCLCAHVCRDRKILFLLYDDAFALLRPRVVLLVGRVDQRIVLLVLLHVLSHRGDALGQWPPLHRGLVLHVLDLLLECVTVHGC